MSITIITCIGGTCSGRMLAVFRRLIEVRSLAIKPCWLTILNDTSMSEPVHLRVLDIVRKRELSSIGQIRKNISEAMKRERFLRRFLLGHAKMDKMTLPHLSADKVALPYFSTDAHAFRGVVKPEISVEAVCHKKEDSVPFWKDTAENPNSELSKPSLFLAVDLWRGKRHRRRCGADFRTVP